MTWYVDLTYEPFRIPTPELAFDCASRSISNVRMSAAASDAARLIAVVVFPTPPFWLAIATILPIFAPRSTWNMLRSRSTWNKDGGTLGQEWSRRKTKTSVVEDGTRSTRSGTRGGSVPDVIQTM